VSEHAHAIDNSKNGWERPPIKGLETRTLQISGSIVAIAFA
jgi:hypothetical protein